MFRLETIRQNLDEKQFSQIAFNHENGKFVVSVYFKCINKMQSIEYKRYEDAEHFYELIK